MINNPRELEAEIILYAIEKSNNIFLSLLSKDIDIEEMKNELKNKSSESENFENDFREAVHNLMSQGILVKERPFSLGHFSLGLSGGGFGHPFSESLPEKIPDKLFLNKDKLKQKISGGLIPSKVERVYVEKENKDKEEIESKLNGLKDMISKKKNETELHNYIKGNELIPAPFIRHEFRSIVQNRQDFLIKNEFGEFEIWELKSPEIKLFEGEIPEDVSEKYKKLKSISKSPDLVKAIEQLSIYKKEFIDGNVTHPNFNNDLKENIYNAKLILVIGSSDELLSDTYFEKLNLERHMLNNLNIITWEMFYEKIKSYYRHLLEE